jgi:hypothetical protein
MDAGGFGFLVAGSRREFIVVNVDESVKVKPPCLFYYLFFSFFAGNYLFFDLFTKMKTLVFCEIHLFSRCGLFCCQTGEKSVFLMLYLYVQLFTWFRLPATKESRPVYHRCM